MRFQSNAEKRRVRILWIRHDIFLMIQRCFGARGTSVAAAIQETANGARINKHGEMIIEGTTTEGLAFKMRIAVAGVSKVLASVSKM